MRTTDLDNGGPGASQLLARTLAQRQGGAFPLSQAASLQSQIEQKTPKHSKGWRRMKSLRPQVFAEDMERASGLSKDDALWGNGLFRERTEGGKIICASCGRKFPLFIRLRRGQR